MQLRLRSPALWLRTAVVTGGCFATLASAQTTLLSNTGTAVVPDGVYSVDVVLSSAGGAGGGLDWITSAGAGGAGVAITAKLAVVPGQSITALVGQGGAPGNGAPGGTGAGPGGAGSGAGGAGGNANLVAASGGGGGGGGASFVQVGSFVMRAGGGGGGGGGSNNVVAPVVAGSAAQSATPTSACQTAQTGLVGVGAVAGLDGGGGGGGGGSYQGAAGAGGTAANEITVSGGGSPSTGGQAGGSCYYAADAVNVLLGTLTYAGGPAGGRGGGGSDFVTPPYVVWNGDPGQNGSISVAAAAPLSVSVVCSPAVILDSPNQVATCTVSSSQAAPSTGLNVNLSLPAANPRYTLACPNPIAIPANASQSTAACTITATANTVPGDGDVPVSVAVAPAPNKEYVVGGTTAQVLVQDDDVAVPPINVSLACTPSVLTDSANQVANCTATSSQAAPAAGLAVGLVLPPANPRYTVACPASLAIAAGASQSNAVCTVTATPNTVAGDGDVVANLALAPAPNQEYVVAGTPAQVTVRDDDSTPAPVAAAVPTLSHWSLLLLSSVFGIAGFFGLRRRQR